jgi:hypothetical protein
MGILVATSLASAYAGKKAGNKRRQADQEEGRSLKLKEKLDEDREKMYAESKNRISNVNQKPDIDLPQINSIVDKLKADNDDDNSPIGKDDEHDDEEEKEEENKLPNLKENKEDDDDDDDNKGFSITTISMKKKKDTTPFMLPDIKKKGLLSFLEQALKR